MNNWLVASYKVNEIKILQRNLNNQNFDFYLPKIKIVNMNSSIKVELLFPGYIFINIGIEKYSTLKYTKGIKNIIKFGNKISFLNENDINDIRIIEKTYNSNPVIQKLEVGQDVFVKEGSLKGRIVQICSLPSRERVEVFLNILGSKKRVTIIKENLSF
jgi:transcriptional antiterminator RfaH